MAESSGGAEIERARFGRRGWTWRPRVYGPYTRAAARALRRRRITTTEKVLPPAEDVQKRMAEIQSTIESKQS